MKRFVRIALISLAVVATLLLALAWWFDPRRTEQWEPKPPVVAPQPTKSDPPPGAIILFDGKNLDQWKSVDTGGPTGWRVDKGEMVVNKAAGNIETRAKFRNFHLHLEWKVPVGITGSGQARGNSGVFLASTGKGDAGYELQIVDSWKNQTYVNGQAGAVYKQSPPLANPSRPPGKWQVYDIKWTAPIFAKDGALKSRARITAHFNGVLVQDDFALEGETAFIGAPSYSAHGPSPIKLQAHGDPSEPISFRNIWVQELR
jgi:hypothetical protein